ncbi:MAG: hypothetical protein HQL30_03800, partial [Candidatus Omnitrophica bacterium]|nr:hypothetical protein [Candidatus Omnitrophota bacterium]
MDKGLFEMGRTMEDAFFRKRDEELIAQQKKIEKMKKTRSMLSEISGIQDQGVLDKFIELDISPEVLASIAVVPLVEVAWADGHVDEQEHKAVLEAAAASGFK